MLGVATQNPSWLAPNRRDDQQVYLAQRVE
jgi:hypothetical protein